MSVHDRGCQERDCGDPNRVAANLAEFLEALADEIAWFEKRAAAHLQARSELRAPTIEAELVSSKLELRKVMQYQDRLERALERKWKLLANYRMMRSPDDDSEAPKTFDLCVRAEDQEGAPPSDRELAPSALAESNENEQR